MNELEIARERQNKVSLYKNQKMKMAYHVPDKIRRDIIGRVNSNAALLFFQGYLPRAAGHYNGKSLSLDDATMAEKFGWSQQKVQRARLILMKAGLFLQHTYGSHKVKGASMTLTCIGEVSVALHLEELKQQLKANVISCDFELVEAVEFKGFEDDNNANEVSLVQTKKDK